MKLFGAPHLGMPAGAKCGPSYRNGSPRRAKYVSESVKDQVLMEGAHLLRHESQAFAIRNASLRFLANKLKEVASRRVSPFAAVCDPRGRREACSAPYCKTGKAEPNVPISEAVVGI